MHSMLHMLTAEQFEIKAPKMASKFVRKMNLNAIAFFSVDRVDRAKNTERIKMRRVEK